MMEGRRTEQLLELLTEKDNHQGGHDGEIRSQGSGIVRGLLSEFDPTTGRIRIVLPSLSFLEPIDASSIVPITSSDVGKEVLVVFEVGNTPRPHVIGFLWQPEGNPQSQHLPVEAKVDGEQVVIEGKNEIVLKCGKASITLTRAGKVLIRGTYVLSRSSGVNRIKGGSVQVN